MTNYHINKHGVPALCKATKGKCPLGEHYESENEANRAISNEMESEYGFLPKNETPEELSIERRKNISELIRRISGTKSTGFDYECYASLTLADQMGLNRIAITDENGLTVNIATNDKSQEINANIFVDQSIDAVSAYYEKMGVPIKDKSTLARVVYHSDNPADGILVQSGGPNVLDAAIIKANKVVDIIEVKELSRGAQLPNSALNVDKEGFISEESLKSLSPHMKDAISNVRIQDADGKDIQLDFGSESENKILPLYHFVEQYKAKGATAFIYTSDDGNKVNKVDLTGPNDEVVARLIDHKIEANVTLRANLNKQNVNEEDIYRFNNLLSKDYFKSGRASHTESFTLKGIREDKISKSGDFVRVGGYILPIKYDEYKDNMNKRIKKTEMKAFKFALTGNIRTNY